MKGKLFSLVVGSLMVGLLCSSNVFAEELTTDATQSVKYQTHVQNEGWQEWKFDGDMSGTSGKSYRLEGIRIETGIPNLGIEYQTHIQNIGWESEAGRGWKSNGVMSGTEGLSYRLEAIEIRLTGAEAENFDVYYQVHAQNIGWMDWAKNGERSGTAGYGYRLEGIRIQILPKGSAAPGSRETPFMQYGLYVEQTGFQTYADYYGDTQVEMFCSFVNNTNSPQTIDDIYMSLTDKNGTVIGTRTKYSVEYAPLVILPGQRGFAKCISYDFNITSPDEPAGVLVGLFPDTPTNSELSSFLNVSSLTINHALTDDKTTIDCLVSNPTTKITDAIEVVAGLYDADNKLIGCLYNYGSDPVLTPNQTGKCTLSDWRPETNLFTNAVKCEAAARIVLFKE
jgi:uncharacterized protein YjdB